MVLGGGGGEHGAYGSDGAYGSYEGTDVGLWAKCAADGHVSAAGAGKADI